MKKNNENAIKIVGWKLEGGYKPYHQAPTQTH